MMTAAEKINGFLKELKFKKKAIGGADEQDVLNKFSELDQLYQEAFGESMSALKARLEEKEQRLRERDRAAEEQIRLAEALGAELNETKERLEAREKSEECLTAQVEQLTRDLAQADLLRATGAGDGRDKERLAELQASYDTLCTRAAGLQRERDELALRTAESTPDAALDRAQLAELKASYDALCTRAAGLQRERDELALRAADPAAARDRAALAELRTKYDDLSSYTYELQRERDELTRRAEEPSPAAALDRAALAELQMKYDALSARMGELQKERDELARRAPSPADAHDREALAAENASLRTELEKLQNDYDLKAGRDDMIRAMLYARQKLTRENNKGRDAILERAKREAEEIVSRASTEGEQLRLQSRYELAEINREKDALADELNDILSQITGVLSKLGKQTDFGRTTTDGEFPAERDEWNYGVFDKEQTQLCRNTI